MENLAGTLLNYLVQISKGLEVTLSIFTVALVLSIPLGVFVALCRLSKISIVRKAAEFYIWVLRGTPLLLQIIFIFFGLPLMGIRFGRMSSAYFAFVLNYAAYFGEIFRSGIQSIERGQTEAASILGFTPWQIQTKIILPQVVKRTLPAIGNEVITLVKDTSLARIIAAYELTFAGYSFMKSAGLTWPLFYTGVFYLIFIGILTLLFNYIEKKLDYFK